MSLPPALLARLAQRGLVQKKNEDTPQNTSQENEEVIAEDYDEMDQDQQGPEGYEVQSRRPAEENFWADRMRARLGESQSLAGYKGCPNKYNIWHKCTLYCVNRWADGHIEPNRQYMRRYKRLLQKFPLPKGWTEIYDPGSGCFYFYSATENLVSWLPPTHPKSQVSKSAAVLRRQLEESIAGGGNVGGGGGSDGEQHSNDDDEDVPENAHDRHQREVDDIITTSMRPRSPPPSKEQSAENYMPPRKQKSRDLDRVISQRQRREKERERGSGSRRNYGRENPDVLDPMDPSAYSDTPRGKWSSGLNTANEEHSQKSTSGTSGGDNARDRDRDHDRDRRKDRRKESSDEEDDYERGHPEDYL